MIVKNYQILETMKVCVRVNRKFFKLAIRD